MNKRRNGPRQICLSKRKQTSKSDVLTAMVLKGCDFPSQRKKKKSDRVKADDKNRPGLVWLVATVTFGRRPQEPVRPPSSAHFVCLQKRKFVRARPKLNNNMGLVLEAQRESPGGSSQPHRKKGKDRKNEKKGRKKKRKRRLQSFPWLFFWPVDMALQVSQAPPEVHDTFSAGQMLQTTSTEL